MRVRLSWASAWTMDYAEGSVGGGRSSGGSGCGLGVLWPLSSDNQEENAQGCGKRIVALPTASATHSRLSIGQWWGDWWLLAECMAQEGELDRRMDC